MKAQRQSAVKRRPLLAHARPSRSTQGGSKGPLHNQAYDVHTGQVFSEVEVPVSKKQSSDWIGELKTPGLVKSRLANARGARSLFDMAKTTVTRHIRSIHSHYLAEVPWEIAEQIWNEVTETHSESFHAWRTLAAAYPDPFTQPRYRYLINIKQPKLPLEDYYRGLTSANTKWLTCLRVTPREMPVADVIRIANISNLAVLDLSDGNANEASGMAVDERVFRTWSELAGKGAFRYLRVLMLGWQEDISNWMFRYLDTFPSLCYILVTDSPRIHQRNRSSWEVQAAQHGWLARSAKQSAKSLRPLLDDKDFYFGAVSGCYYTNQELFDQLAPDKQSEDITRLPVLECWLGSPRIWTHVVEEYPGTRTVWFDNIKVHSPQLSQTQATNMQETQPHDNYKRSRGPETPTNELNSPPPKRTTAKRKIKGRSVNQLLAEFGHV